jgi:hypothetical protein
MDDIFAEFLPCAQVWAAPLDGRQDILDAEAFFHAGWTYLYFVICSRSTILGLHASASSGTWSLTERFPQTAPAS